MADIEIMNACKSLRLVASTKGGTIWRFETASGQPLFRAPPKGEHQAGEQRTALQAACFPLLPFGNRIRGNRFRYEGQEYSFKPNMDWDRHYLHGDGWTGEWHVTESTSDALTMKLRHEGGGSPYVYEAEQHVSLTDDMLVTTLTVCNRGPVALPFGLGLHPYFPMSQGVTLRAKADSVWEEDASWLPTTKRGVQGELDFSTPRRLPRSWVNNVFEGWDGSAEIDWPETGLSLQIKADPLFSRYLIFISDPQYDPNYQYEFFCFEPMSHSIDAHNMDSGGGLVRLMPGECLSGSVRYTVSTSKAG